MSVLSRVDPKNKGSFEDEVSGILFKYVDTVYVRRFGKDFVDRGSAREFFERAVEAGVKLSPVYSYTANTREQHFRNAGVNHNRENLLIIESVYKD